MGADLIKKQPAWPPISDEHSYEKMKEKILDEAARVPPRISQPTGRHHCFPLSPTKPDLLEILDLR